MTSLLCLTDIAYSWLGAIFGIVIILELGVIVYLAVTGKKGKEIAKTSPKQAAFRSVTYLTKIALFSAMAVILLYIEFPLLPATPWLKLNVSDVPCLLAAFMFGPISGFVVNAAKVGVCLLLRGTSTGFVGDLSNLISGTVYAVIAGLIYLIRRNKKGAIAALCISSAVFCGAMWLCNQFMLLPFFGMSDPAVMMPALWWTLLFNFIKTVITGVITFFIYKPLSRALHWQIDPSRRKKRPAPAADNRGAEEEQTDVG